MRSSILHKGRVYSSRMLKDQLGLVIQMRILYEQATKLGIYCGKNAEREAMQG